MYVMSVILIICTVVALFDFVFKKLRKQREMLKKYPGYPRGYFMNQGISMGIVLGAGIGAAFNNLAAGIAAGVATGAAIGSGWEKRHKNEIRPITDEEKALRKRTFLFLACVLSR